MKVVVYWFIVALESVDLGQLFWDTVGLSSVRFRSHFQLTLSQVMREKSIERETALSFVREKRSRVHPNPGFWEQLGVWHECHSEVFELVGDVELGKEVYREWKTKAELEMSNKVLTLNAINTKSGRKI